MPQSLSAAPRRYFSIVLIVALAAAILWWLTREHEDRPSDLPAAASAERALAPPPAVVREERSPAAEGENWLSLVAEIAKAQAAQDQERVTDLLERLRKCDDPALVEYLFARLCHAEDAELWVSLLALKAVRRLGDNGEVLEVDEPLVSRVLAVISLSREADCRERVALFLQVLLAAQGAPCTALARYADLALAVARPGDVVPVVQEVAGRVGCSELVERLALQGGVGGEPTNVDELLARLRGVSKEGRAAMVRDYLRTLPVWEAARVAERLEAEPREFPSTLDPYQVALEELAKKEGGLDYLETRIWAGPSGETMNALVRAVAEAESDRSYDILRALILEQKNLGAELPAALVGLCNMTNRRDTERVCLSALQSADGEAMDANTARLLAGAAMLTAEKERQKGMLSERGLESVRWVLASAKNEELVRAILDECAQLDELRQAMLPQLASELLWRADHVTDPDLAARLRQLAGR